MKNLRKIKWENIVAIAMIGLSIYSMVEHVKMNGFYSWLWGEVVIYGLSCVGIWWIVRDIRKNPTNWLIDLDN